MQIETRKRLLSIKIYCNNRTKEWCFNLNKEKDSKFDSVLHDVDQLSFNCEDVS
jgi:hypothetical protein